MAGLFDDLVPQASGGGQQPNYGGAITNIESGGRYDALGPVTRTGDRAYGKYQVMGANVPVWTQEILGRRMTPQEFVANPQAQDAVFNAKFGSYVQKYGPEGAAKAWFAGERGMNNPNARDQLGTSVAQYGQKFMQGLGAQPLNIQPPAAQASAGLFDDLVPKEGTAPVTPVESAPLPAPITATDMGGYSPEQIPQAGEDIGRATAALRGAYSGATANWGDELAGLGAAGGGRALPGAAMLALEHLTGRDLFGARQRYADARDTVRSDLDQAKEQYPGTTIAGQVGGAVALPGGAMLNAATMPARIARSAAVGAGFGAASGAGEGTTTEDRASRARSGAAVGAGAGAVAPPVMAGLGAAAGTIAQPIVSAVRGMINPEAEAGRRVVGAITRDMRQPGGVQHAAEMAAASRTGAPVVNLDIGGETTRALARSAANTSPEGRHALQSLADARFEGQADRATQFIRNLVGPVDTQGTRDALRTAAQNVNRPAYERAYRAPGAQSMWDEGFEQLMQAPVVQEAARAATRTGANRAAAEGFTPVRNPFHWDDQGRWTLAGDARPNLQFWDHVKRNLDDTITRLQRQGENSAARDAQQLRSALVQRLDDLVPEFNVARAGAARFFGAENAWEAGENFVRSGMTAAEGARALARMTPAERELFRQGFAARLIDEINNTRDRVNVLNKIGQSQEARAKLQLALGPQGYRNVEAFLRVEQAMDRLRGALGNSTTARQLAELGLAGGAGYSLSGGDVTTAGGSALALYLTRRAGARIDERVARRVAEMLTSNDPQVLARGIRMAANNQNIVRALRDLDQQISRISGQQGTQTLPGSTPVEPVRQAP